MIVSLREHSTSVNQILTDACYCRLHVGVNIEHQSPVQPNASTGSQVETPQDAVRAEMMGQLAQAESDLGMQIDTLHQSGATRDGLVAAVAQQAVLATLQRRLSSASPEALIAIRAEVGAAMVSVAAQVAQTQALAGNARIAEVMQMEAAKGAARAQVDAFVHDVFERGIFDPYLIFASDADEEAYREREASRRAFIESELLRGSPDAILNASGASIGQMLDASGQGAGSSPQFQDHWDALLDRTNTLREAFVTQGRSTEAFDHALRAELRQLLRNRGVSDVEVEALLTAYPNPIEAARRVQMQDAPPAVLEETLRNVLRNADPVQLEVIAVETPEPSITAVSPDILAGLSAANLVVTDHATSEEPSHGLIIGERPASNHGRGV